MRKLHNLLNTNFANTSVISYTLKVKRKDWIIAILIFTFAFLVRYLYITGYGKILFDYDQYEDLFLTKRILIDRDLPVIGRPIYGDPRLHQGVLFIYFNTVPFLLFNWNPVGVTLWIALFNAGVVLAVFYLSLLLFKNRIAAIISSLIVAASFEFIQFATWISNATLAIMTAPLAFLGLYLYFKEKKMGLIVTALFLGLSLQSDVMFLYLIPIFVVIFIALKMKFPDYKLLSASILTFLATVSTMIITELKLSFAGVKTLLFFGNTFDDAKIPVIKRLTLFLTDLGKTFSYNLLPTNNTLGIYLALAITTFLLLKLFAAYKSRSAEKKPLIFLIVFLFSPLIMLVLGYHRQPWFLIGILSAIAISAGYSIAKLKHPLLISIIVLFSIWSNLTYLFNPNKSAYNFFGYENSSFLANQIPVVDYMYQEAEGKPFAFNAVTYPMHHYALWAYHLGSYGEKKYDYLPTWLGATQDYPYNVIGQSDGSEKLYFLIMDKSVRIPEINRTNALIWADANSTLLEAKEFEGFTVQKRYKE